MASASIARTEERELQWEEGTLLKPIQNKMMHIQLGSPEFVGHVTKLGVETKDGGLKLTRTSMLSYGDVIVVPFMFILLEPVTRIVVDGEELEFYDQRHTKILAAVVSTKGIVESAFRPAILEVGGADSVESLLSADADIQYTAAQWKRQFAVHWTQSVIVFDKHVTFTDAAFILMSEEEGKRIKERKAEVTSKTGEFPSHESIPPALWW